jgi:competence protein ComEC
VPNVAVWLAASLTCGVFAASLWPQLTAGPWLITVVWCVALACVVAGRAAAYLALGACCATCSLGALTLSRQALDTALEPTLRDALHRQFGGFAPGSLDEPAGLTPVPARFVLLDDAVRRAEVVLLRARVTAIAVDGAWHAVAGGAAVTVAGTVEEEDRRRWHGGAHLEAPVTFRRPARYLNDGVPDAERARALRGIAVVGTVKSGLLVEVREPGGVLARASAGARDLVRRAVAGTVGTIDQVAAAVVVAVLIGDESGLPPDLRERWQAAGTYHVVAISGGNIAVLVALVVALARLAGCGPRPAAAAALAAVAAFAAVVLPGSSVQRASLMAVFHLGARTLDQRTASWQALALAVAVMLTADPLALGDPGLLLTCGATVALIECSRTFGRASPRGPLGWLVAAIVATACVEAVVFPIQVWWFTRVSAAGLLLNLVAVPMMTVAQVAGLAAVALTLVDLPVWPVAWVAAQAVWAMDLCTRLTEWMPALAWMTPRPPAWLVALYYLALVAWWWAAPRLQWIAGPLVVASGLAIAWGAPALMPTRPVQDVTLTVLDVGQGESLLLESGRWRALVDAGGRPFGDGLDIGRRVVVPSLWAHGVAALDALLITHPDPDHVGGAAAVMDALRVRQLWLGVDVPGHEASTALLERAGVEGAAVIARRAGDIVRDGPARIRVLHPSAPDWERRRVRNDDSVVLEIVHGDVALLVTGDVGAEVEREILPRLAPARLRILKVGHHGSRTSTSQRLLDAWQPHLALVSCGRANSFGHPSPAVLARLRDAGATVFRTDVDGQITVRTDGRQVWVETFRGRRLWTRPV